MPCLRILSRISSCLLAGTRPFSLIDPWVTGLSQAVCGFQLKAPLGQVDFPALNNPTDRHKPPVTHEQWHYGFTNTFHRRGIPGAV